MMNKNETLNQLASYLNIKLRKSIFQSENLKPILLIVSPVHEEESCTCND